MYKSTATTTTDLQVAFSHVHLYVDKVQSLQEYKEIERSLNSFHGVKPSLSMPCLDDREIWNRTAGGALPGARRFESQNRDIVKQLLVGFGFRITGIRIPDQGSSSNVTTKTFLVTSKDSSGVQFLVSSLDETRKNIEKDDYEHFDSVNLRRFYRYHADRQGIAVLGFQVNSVGIILERYQTLHSSLIHSYRQYENENKDSKSKVLEVYAYYSKNESPDQKDRLKKPDRGTILRFVEVEKHFEPSFCILPGIEKIDAEFDTDSQPAYCDHWVSNVYSRAEFLRTLEDTLGFTPKVDFNAGVVAAGEAQIESTVTGNSSTFETKDKSEALKDQSQVFLPINNAVSKAGHVHSFLEEIGQGVQHVASRVDNLVEFVRRCNRVRKIAGEGFTFLNIPRSYYGILTVGYLAANSGISENLASKLVEVCKSNHILASDGAVGLDIEKEDFALILESSASSLTISEQKSYRGKKDAIVSSIASSRYRNLYSLLRRNISESSYMEIVKNEILVDVQGDDILYQIFTCNILQRRAGEEAPFLEFIQRVCSDCNDEDGCPVKIRAGCGGFGIRNFLTLFLSIEVSKSIHDVAEAARAGDAKRSLLAQRKVDCFTSQLNDADPILTQISDAMTDEGKYRKLMERATQLGDMEGAAALRIKMDKASNLKREANARLMECNVQYESLMRSIRESER